LQQPGEAFGFGHELLLAPFGRLSNLTGFEGVALALEFLRLDAQVRNARRGSGRPLRGFDVARGTPDALELLDAVVGRLQARTHGFALLFELLALAGQHLVGLLQRQGPDWP
jgi:hypothetical protein